MSHLFVFHSFQNQLQAHRCTYLYALKVTLLLIRWYNFYHVQRNTEISKKGVHYSWNILLVVKSWCQLIIDFKYKRFVFLYFFLQFIPGQNHITQWKRAGFKAYTKANVANNNLSSDWLSHHALQPLVCHGWQTSTKWWPFWIFPKFWNNIKKHDLQFMFIMKFLGRLKEWSSALFDLKNLKLLE